MIDHSVLANIIPTKKTTFSVWSPSKSEEEVQVCKTVPKQNNKKRTSILNVVSYHIGVSQKKHLRNKLYLCMPGLTITV